MSYSPPVQRGGRRGYYARIWSPDARHQRGGRERWIALGDDLEEAKRRLERIRFDGEAPTREGNVKQWAKRWLEIYVAVHRTPRALRDATSVVDRYLAPFLGSIQIRKLAPDDLRRYRLFLQSRKKPLSLQTIACYLSDVKCFVHWLESSGAIHKAPIPDRLLPKIPESPPKGFTADELAKLTAIADPFGFAVRVMAFSGVRYGELTRLQANDLDGEALLVYGETKSRRMRRAPVPVWLAEEIRTHVGRLVPFTIAERATFLRKVRDLSGVQGFTSHRCRHTYAYEWLAAGGSVTTLQKALGHAGLGVTMRYAKPDDRLVASEARKVFAARAS